jgi:energy-coupling factor transport system substrate-specific component
MGRKYLFIILISLLGLAIYIVPFISMKGSILDPNAGFLSWGLIATVFVSFSVLGLFLEFERAATGAKEIALVAMLGTISALSRLPFASLMNFQPCTFFIICSGYVFGPMAGFMTASMTALVSNMFLGHGPWTPYQMFTWGLVGITAGWLRGLRLTGRKEIIVLAVFGFIWGWLYGVIINVWFWAFFVQPHTIVTYLLTLLNAVIWDGSHAVANAFFVSIFGARVIRTLDRFKKRFYWKTGGVMADVTVPSSQTNANSN